MLFFNAAHDVNYNVIPEIQQFVAIDWSGARGPKLPGLQVAACAPGRGAPKLIYPRGENIWTRQGLLEHLIALAKSVGPVMAGFDMSVAFPFVDCGCYFPGYAHSPPDAPSLWRTVDEACHGADDFYARPFTPPGHPVAEYFNAPGYRGSQYDVSRLRVTDQRCLQWTRPSSVFNGVGPGSVGTGSLAGMRFFHAMRKQTGLRIAIWPFDAVRGYEQLVLCEIFPRFYLKRAGLDPRRWRERDFLNIILRHHKSRPAPTRAYSEDEFDALFSAAVLRFLSAHQASWRPATMTDEAARYEGWIFGVT